MKICVERHLKANIRDALGQAEPEAFVESGGALHSGGAVKAVVDAFVLDCRGDAASERQP